MSMTLVDNPFENQPLPKKGWKIRVQSGSKDRTGVDRQDAPDEDMREEGDAGACFSVGLYPLRVSQMCTGM
jgi:hypothetical protein